MKHVSRHIIIFFILLFPVFTMAQERIPQSMIEDIIESNIGHLEEETDVALIIEDLQDLAEHPININSCNEQDLSRLYLLNPVQIHQLLSYVVEFGPVYSIYELATLQGFTPELLQKIEPFIYFGSAEEKPVTFTESLKKGRNELLARTLGTLQKADGYQTREDGSIPYEGNRFRYYTRYRFTARDKLQFGFTAEKDPGEPFFRASNKPGFDYYSVHASWTPGKTLQQITLGDFVVRSGQGLVLWQGYTMGKSPEVLDISKTGQGIRPYTSVDENAFFRGVAVSLKKSAHSLDFFFSHHQVDGNVVTDDAGNFIFTSLQTSGYHRTKSEIEDEKSVSETDAGVVYKLQFSKLKIGATFTYQHFDKPFQRSVQLYNQFLFKGDENYTAGADYIYSSGTFQIFGEAAVSKSGGLAFLQGAVLRINDRLNLSALYRRFDKNYHALWANTFADGSNTNNESGLYFGFRFLPAKYITLSAYSDLYRSRWYSYSTAGPSTGWDALAQMDVRLSENFNFYLRFKNEERDQKMSADKLYVNQAERTQKTRLHFNYRLSEFLLMKTRIEHVYFNSSKPENGLLIFQDLQFQSISFPLSFSARLAWFNTDSYDSRIYAYESDLLYTFSVPALYGRGFRTYLNLHYRMTSKLDAWLKFGNTLWTDRETISTGYNEIEGKCKSELKFQLRLKF